MTPLLLVAVVLLHPQVGGAVDSLAGTTLKVTAAQVGRKVEVCSS